MRYLFIIIAFAATLAAGCSTDPAGNYCFEQVQTGIDEVTGPETTVINEPVTLQASFKIYNSCGTFNRFNESSGFPKTIRAVVNYSGCNCQEIIKTETKPYIFQYPRTGQYILKFVKPDGTFITKTITVTQ